MALKGTLKDFPIADIFQLVGNQQKSGSLYITNEEQTCHIMFDKGMIIIARFKQSNEDLLLGSMLLRAGLILEEQLEEALENQQSTLKSIGDILLSMKFIPPEILTEFINLQVKEVLFRLFQWKEGLYEFVPEEFKYNKNIIIPKRTEQLLLDGFRMIDEWPAVISKISSLDSVFRPSADATDLHQIKETDQKENFDNEIEMAFKEYEPEEGPPKKLKGKEPFSQGEKKVLPLLDGIKTAREIIDLSRLGTFEACSAIASLLDRDLITPVDFGPTSRLDSQAVFKPSFLTKKARLYRSIVDMTVLGIILLMLPTLIFNFYSNIIATDSTKGGFFINRGENPLGKYFNNNELEQIRFALELYKLKNDTYPETLNELVIQKFLPSSHITRNVYFRKTGSSYIMLP